MISSNDITSKLVSGFPFEPTTDQLNAFRLFGEFLLAKDNRELFVLRGYAGTGKTTLVKALINVLPQLKMKSVLLAPTGRAAKVLSKYTNTAAFTIHSKIYEKATEQSDFRNWFLKHNRAKNTLFIVDEASMIGTTSNIAGSELMSTSNLLDDLLQFVWDGSNCKVLFIGDVAQLPPVGERVSTALSPKRLESYYGVHTHFSELKEVKRQQLDSGILFNATKLRELLVSESTEKIPQFKLSDFEDVVLVPGDELQEVLESAYANYGEEEVVVVTRSNKRANLFNRQIRSRILWKDGEINGGDQLMVVRNNYHWLDRNSPIAFIANGDALIAERITNEHELYGLRFVNASVKLVDYPNLPALEVKLMLDVLDLESPSLTQQQYNQLYELVRQDYMNVVKSKGELVQAMKNDGYLNALQVKFAYAVTCHKAQGGQWDAVFVDLGYIAPEMLDVEFIRWLYTAVTRAKQKLYLVNFPADWLY